MKILIIKLGALGDIIASTAVVNEICNHHKNDNTYLLTSDSFKDIFTNLKGLNVYSFKRKGLLNSVKTILWIRKHKFDRIYDLQSNDRTTIYCALSGCSYCAGNHPRYPYHVHPENKYIGECHSFDRLNLILESAGIKKAKALPFLPIPQNTVTEISKWLSEKNILPKSYILFHAGSSPSHMEKRWPYFKELANDLCKHFTIVWVGGEDDVVINRQLSKAVGIDATNVFNILGLIELGKKAAFAVTNDSAPMHILSCSEIPVIGLFGPTYARRTHALGQFENVITANNEMAENDLDFKPQNITLITVDIVLKKLRDKKLI